MGSIHLACVNDKPTQFSKRGLCIWLKACVYVCACTHALMNFVTQVKTDRFALPSSCMLGTNTYIYKQGNLKFSTLSVKTNIAASLFSIKHVLFSLILFLPSLTPPHLTP